MIHYTTSEAYLAVLARLLDDPQYRPSPRGLPTAEVADLQFFVLRPSDGPVATADGARNATMARYLEAEKRLYASGELSAAVWAEEASGFWSGIANPDGTVNSNYGHLLWRNRSLPGGRTPWEWARNSLLADRDSRQAFARVSLSEHQRDGVLDQPCTMHLNFSVREGRLNASAVMRSNDTVRGLAYDMPWFCHCQLKMAGELGLPAGTYSHFAHSMHLYDRDRVTALKMLGRTVP